MQVYIIHYLRKRSGYWVLWWWRGTTLQQEWPFFLYFSSVKQPPSPSLWSWTLQLLLGLKTSSTICWIFIFSISSASSSSSVLLGRDLGEQARWSPLGNSPFLGVHLQEVEWFCSLWCPCGFHYILMSQCDLISLIPAVLCGFGFSSSPLCMQSPSWAPSLVCDPFALLPVQDLPKKLKLGVLVLLIMLTLSFLKHYYTIQTEYISENVKYLRILSSLLFWEMHIRTPSGKSDVGTRGCFAILCLPSAVFQEEAGVEGTSTSRKWNAGCWMIFLEFYYTC